eukprot:6073059-Prymnesium_polylepis.1
MPSHLGVNPPLCAAEAQITLSDPPMKLLSGNMVVSLLLSAPGLRTRRCDLDVSRLRHQSSSSRSCAALSCRDGRATAAQ